MVIKKVWWQKDAKDPYAISRQWKRAGFYLFGFIPLYIWDVTPRSP